MATSKKKSEPKQKKPRTTDKPKAEKKAAPAKPAPKIFNNDDPEAKALFLQHLPKIKSLKEKVGTATADLRNAYKTAKAQGAFEKSDFDYAFQLETAEQEAKTRAKIARNLVIARFMGSDLGAQLDLFLEPDRTPAADRAYHEGQTASMTNKPAQPVYAPETEQYRQYMAGFHDHQEQIAKGIKPHPEVEADTKATKAQKAAVKAQKEEDAKAFDPAMAPGDVTSGVPLSRSEFAQQQAATSDKSHFQKA